MTEKFYFVLFPSYPTLWLLIQEGASEPINVKGEETEQGKKKLVRKKNHRWIIIGLPAPVVVWSPCIPLEVREKKKNFIIVDTFLLFF